MVQKLLSPAGITLISSAVLLAAGLAEWLHVRRCRQMANLAFGPVGEPQQWTRVVPFLRPVCLALITWGLLTLLQINPKVFTAEELPENKYRHVVLVYDVSPSMKLEDAGPQRSAFLSALFSVVGLHGSHVTAGLLWLGTMMAQVYVKGFRDPIMRRLLCFNLFWHVLDIIWIALFTIVYLMGEGL